MAKFERQSRILASAAFFLAAAAPGGAWFIYLFGVTPELWRQSLTYALSQENEYRVLFVTMALATVFSALAFVVVLLSRRKNLLRAVLIGGVAQAAAYALLGGWFLLFISVMPLPWAYKVQHEV
ncbi:MAG TPA: hypothetical protein VFE23_00610 [Usitatibacter sp.]|jgi:hypothetical protein|nr:hypothetical protein [Usitatibacter sp.]